MPIVDVEAYVDNVLLGGFRKLDIPPIPIHKPHERTYAESEISIVPYPPRQGVQSLVSTVLHNATVNTTTVNLEFGWAQFGMGIPFTSTGMVPTDANGGDRTFDGSYVNSSLDAVNVRTSMCDRKTQ